MGTMTEQAWEAFHAPLYQFIRRRETVSYHASS